MGLTVGIIGGGLQLGGMIMQADAQRKAADAQKKAMEYQAQRNEEAADRVAEETQEEIRRFDLQFRKMQGQNRASIGASGIAAGSGSAMAVMAENLRNAELDKQAIEYNGSVREKELRDEAHFNRLGGQSAAAAGRTAASATLLSGTGQVLSNINWD